MHGLIFETSVCYWQNQPGCYLNGEGNNARTTPNEESFDKCYNFHINLDFFLSVVIDEKVVVRCTASLRMWNSFYFKPQTFSGTCIINKT